MGDGTTSDQHVSGEAANARPLLFVLTRLWGAVRGFASLKLPTLGRKPATKRTYQQHAPFRTEGFIQLRRSWPAVQQAANDHHGSDFPVLRIDRYPHQRLSREQKPRLGRLYWL
jgi:hypothetical protein